MLGTRQVVTRREYGGRFATETVEREAQHYVRCCSPVSGAVKTADLGGLECVQRAGEVTVHCCWIVSKLYFDKSLFLLTLLFV